MQYKDEKELFEKTGLVVAEGGTVHSVTDIDRLRDASLTAEQFADLAGHLSAEAIAVEIKHAHEQLQHSIKRGLEWAYVCGRWLCWAKSCIPQGQWEQWVRDNTDLANSTSRCYMAVFNRWDAIQAKRQQVGVLTINQALGYTATEEENEDEPLVPLKETTATSKPKTKRTKNRSIAKSITTPPIADDQRNTEDSAKEDEGGDEGGEEKPDPEPLRTTPLTRVIAVRNILENILDDMVDDDSGIDEALLTVLDEIIEYAETIKALKVPLEV